MVKRLQGVPLAVTLLKVGQVVEERERVEPLVELHLRHIEHELEQHELVVKDHDFQVGVGAGHHDLVHFLFNLLLTEGSFLCETMRMGQLHEADLCLRDEDQLVVLMGHTGARQ